jgi:alpha-glucoside transport system permease protein
VAASAATVEVAPPPVVEEGAGRKVTRVLGRAPVYLILVFIGALWLIPTFGLFFTSLLSPSDLNEQGWWQVISEPAKLTLDNYRNLLDTPAITSALWTTVWITLGATIIPLFVAALAAYAFAWLEFPWRDGIFIFVIALLVVPLQMALIPIFSLYNTLGIFDTVIGIVLFHTAFALPFAIFLLRNFFIGIPKEILESARIDGAGELGIFFRLILPLGLPALASLAIFQFLWTWNDLLVALTLGRQTQPITVAIYSQLRQFGSNIDLIASASFVSLLLPLAVFFAFQRYFVQGLLAGSVK